MGQHVVEQVQCLFAFAHRAGEGVAGPQPRQMRLFVEILGIEFQVALQIAGLAFDLPLLLGAARLPEQRVGDAAVLEVMHGEDGAGTDEGGDQERQSELGVDFTHGKSFLGCGGDRGEAARAGSRENRMAVGSGRAAQGGPEVAGKGSGKEARKS